MAIVNANYQSLKDSYLFADISKRVAAFARAHPEKEIIRLGIGDVTLPLPEAAVSALHEAADDMACADRFHGYAPEQGYSFLRESIQGYYRRFGVSLDAQEIFVSDGAKSDLGNITDLFSPDNTALIPDPVYPVYVDTNLMDGREIVYLRADADNAFLPMPNPAVHADLIYLCSPNNPTGAVYSREQLRIWVDYALAHEAVILFDAAYEAFVEGNTFPHSIYEIEGAMKCAIEFCSLSKTAGFTGTRCGYTVVPHALSCQGVSLHRLWLRRQTTKFNGVPYIVQKAAAAVFSDAGISQAREMIGYYKENARLIGETLTQLGVRFYGGVHSPYIWMQCPGSMDSWGYFDFLLENVAVVGTPGAGFGANGEGYFRLTGFGNREKTIEAMARLRAIDGNKAREIQNKL